MLANAVPLSPVSFLRRSADVFPDLPAIRDPLGMRNATLTYAQFRDRADELAGAIRGSGVQPGERVAVLSRNTPHMLAMHFGVPGAQTVLVPLNIRLAPDEYLKILNHCEPKILFVENALADRIRPVLDEMAIQSVVELPSAEGEGEITDGLGGVDYARWASNNDDGLGLQLPRREDDPLAINYTSGTTGGPKGAVYTHRGAYLNALGQALELKLSSQETYLWTLPMFHCNGWCHTWAVTATASRHVCMRDFEPDVALRLIQDEGVTRFCGAPVVLNSMAQSPRASDYAYDQEVIGAVGGAPPAPATIEAMQSLGVSVVHLYGLTETYGPSTICEVQPGWSSDDLGAYAQRLSRQGMRTINVEAVRVIDEHGRTVPPDASTMGEIVVRSNTVMKEYFRDPDQTRSALKDGWFHTGDLAVVHADGYIEIRDRSKDIIVSGGENVSSIEVESVVMSHPAVSEVAIVGTPHQRWGEVPVAFVTLRPGESATAPELVEWVRSKLAHYKAPKEVIFGPLPKTSTGKIQKFELRERLRST